MIADSTSTQAQQLSEFFIMKKPVSHAHAQTRFAYRAFIHVTEVFRDFAWHAFNFLTTSHLSSEAAGH